MEEWREYNYRLYDEGSQRAWHRVMYPHQLLKPVRIFLGKVLAI